MERNSSDSREGAVRGTTAILRRLARLSADDRVRRRAISAFLAVLLAFLVIPSIPPQFFLIKALGGEKLMSSIKDAVTPYGSHFGLLETWAMFAPNPGRQNTYLDAEITYRNGRKHIWTFPQMQELSFSERYAKERYRKFANERLWPKEHSELWPDAARYIARLNADPSNPPQAVKLVHYWSEIPPPSSPDEAPQPEHWSRDVFFTYMVKPGDLR